MTIIATFALVAGLLWTPDRAAAHDDDDSMDVQSAAHGDDGSMDVQWAAQTRHNTIRLELSILYPDGELAADSAIVTATLKGPSGTVIPNVHVPRTLTGYGADLTVTRPGTWRIAVGSTNPVAEATIEVNIFESGPQTRSSPLKLLALPGAAAVLLVGIASRQRRRRQTKELRQRKTLRDLGE